MTRRCRHEFEKKPDYPEDTICQKCQTIWRIPDYLNWTPKQLMTLLLEIRREVLKWQVERFNKEHPDYYRDLEL
jgi:hypothetical protein